VKKKVYLIQPTYRDQHGKLLKGKRLYVISLALPALSGAIPPDWEKQFCFEYFEDVDFDTDASVIGISSMGYEIFRGAEIAAEFKRRGKAVIFGGFQSRLNPGFVGTRCDAIVHGYPGLAAMAEILSDAERHTLKPEYHCGTDIGHAFDYSILSPRRLIFMPVLLSVGCRNACDYCVIGSLFRGNYTLRPIEHVVAELEALHRVTRRIAVVDTNFYNDHEYLVRLCREMIARRFRFFWGAQSSIDIGGDPEVLDLLRRAGCKVLFIGLESIEQANLNAVHKRYRVDSYRERIRNIHRAGIRVAAFFIYGMDGDTRETAAQLSEFIKSTHISLPMLNVLVPLPGTRVYERLEREGRLQTSETDDFLKNNPVYNSSFNLCFYQPKNMTPKELEYGFLELLGRLSGWLQILRRSLVRSPGLTAFLLYMNSQFRREYLALKKQIGARWEGRTA
jgi:radical SAM superfamily enzyme YgiQ (UPF0313 family)